MRRQYDIVGFDPRGVGASVPLDCLSDPDLDQFLGMDPTPDDSSRVAGVPGPGQASSPPAARPAAARCWRTCRPKRSPGTWTSCGPRWGIAQLNYLGKSYGTYIGAVYADLFPKNVGRFVLDGVVAPDLTSTEISEGQARGFEIATQAYMASCVKTAGARLAPPSKRACSGCATSSKKWTPSRYA